MHHARLSAVLSLSVLLSTLVAAQDISYTFTTIDVPGATRTQAFGINTAGQIVGVFDDATGSYGFVKDGDTFTPIDVPGSTLTFTFGVNTAGQIVGMFSDGIIGVHGFVKDGDTFTTIDVPGSSGTVAHGINDFGQIAGYFIDPATGRRRGFVRDGATFTTFDVPGAMHTQVRGINNNSQIIGDFNPATGGSHGFVRDGATFTTIDVPGSTSTVAWGINAAGQIVGQFDDAMGTHGFVKDGDTFTTIDVPGSRDTQVFGINTAGQIVGAFGSHGFVATPNEGDMTPPVITMSASPATLWPPNGRLVTVTVSGTIIDAPDGSGVQTSTYRVIDEYGQIQPSGNVTLGMDGRYAFTVELQASRRGNDQNGRHYTIKISATDHAANLGSASATVTVPHN